MNDLFINDHYRVLKKIYDKISKFGNEKYCPLSQNEIAVSLNLSRSTTNKIFKDLSKNGYIQMFARGKWIITKKAEIFIKETKNLK